MSNWIYAPAGSTAEGSGADKEKRCDAIATGMAGAFFRARNALKAETFNEMLTYLRKYNLATKECMPFYFSHIQAYLRKHNNHLMVV